jgi:hypothetical protein
MAERPCMDAAMSDEGRVQRPDRPGHPEVTKGVLGNMDDVSFAAVEVAPLTPARVSPAACCSRNP